MFLLKQKIDLFGLFCRLAVESSFAVKQSFQYHQQLLVAQFGNELLCFSYLSNASFFFLESSSLVEDDHSFVVTN